MITNAVRNAFVKKLKRGWDKWPRIKKFISLKEYYNKFLKYIL